MNSARALPETPETTTSRFAPESFRGDAAKIRRGGNPRKHSRYTFFCWLRLNFHGEARAQ